MNGKKYIQYYSSLGNKLFQARKGAINAPFLQEPIISLSCRNLYFNPFKFQIRLILWIFRLIILDDAYFLVKL